MLRHLRPYVLWKRSRSNIVQLFVPIFRKGEQGAIELPRLWIFAPGRIGRIAVAINHVGNLAVFNTRCAMPGVHDVLVLVSSYIAKQDHFPVSMIGDRNHLADRWHPPTD